MSHVDEGELTAYADGAYAADSPDAQRIEAHLALCENCRNRLEQARALSGRAAQILAVAAPIDIAMPEFAEVRAAAATVKRRRNAIPLTWAATVILAIGLGWFGRGALLEPELRQVVTTAATREAPADVAAASPVPASVPPQLRNAAPAGEASRRAAPATPIERQEAQAANALDQATSLAAAAEAPPPSVAPKTGVEGGSAAGRAAVVAQPNIEYITSGDAERRGVELHFVPELEVVRVGLSGGEVIIEQKLPDGQLLTIRQSADQAAGAGLRQLKAVAPTAPVAAERAATRADVAAKMEATAVEVTRNALRLRVSAPLSQDSLRALAAKIR